MFFATWLDDSLTKLLKGACRSVSQATFETSLLARMDSLLRDQVSRKRKA